MNISLVANAFDSLTKGLEHYNNYLKKENLYKEGFQDLKASIIFIHHATELLLKYRLFNVNELFIIKSIDDENFLNSYSRIRQFKESHPRTKVPLLLESLIGNSKVMTVGFKDLITRYNSVFFLHAIQKEALYNLSFYRNQLMHLGLSQPMAFYEIMNSINICLAILRLFIEEIDKEDTVFDIDSISNTFRQGSIIAEAYWSIYWDENFLELKQYIDDFCNNEDIKKYLNNKNISLKCEYNHTIRPTQYNFTFNSTLNNKSFILITENDSVASVTKFMTNTDKLVDKFVKLVPFIYEHKNKDNSRNFFILTPPIPMDTQYFWKYLSSKEKKHIKLDSEEFNKRMKTFISKYILTILNDNGDGNS